MSHECYLVHSELTFTTGKCECSSLATLLVFYNHVLHCTTILYKKHLDASVKERPQTLLVPSEQICKCYMQQTYLTPSIISNLQILIVRRENSTRFRFLFTTFLVYHDLKKKDVLMPRSMHLHTEIYRIWKVYLNYWKCTWKVSILLYKHHAIIESRATRHSAVSAFTETVETLKRSIASMPMRYCCSMIGC